MKAIVAATLREISTPLTMQEIDISTDPDLESRYGVEIPVLFVDGKKVAKYRIRQDELMRILSAVAGGAGRAG